MVTNFQAGIWRELHSLGSRDLLLSLPSILFYRILHCSRICEELLRTKCMGIFIY